MKNLSNLLQKYSNLTRQLKIANRGECSNHYNELAEEHSVVFDKIAAITGSSKSAENAISQYESGIRRQELKALFRNCILKRSMLDEADNAASVTNNKSEHLLSEEEREELLFQGCFAWQISMVCKEADRYYERNWKSYNRHSGIVAKPWDKDWKQYWQGLGNNAKLVVDNPYYDYAASSVTDGTIEGSTTEHLLLERFEFASVVVFYHGSLFEHMAISSIDTELAKRGVQFPLPYYDGCTLARKQ